MAILVVLLGPAMIAQGLLSLGFPHYLAWMRDQLGARAPLIPTPLTALLEFAERTAPIMFAIGLLMLAGGIAALRGAANGRMYLLAAAWGTAAGMVGLAIVWEVVALRAHLDVLLQASGIILHAGQGAIALRAGTFLRSQEVRDALGP
jgi:hypothetical protein